LFGCKDVGTHAAFIWLAMIIGLFIISEVPLMNLLFFCGHIVFIDKLSILNAATPPLLLLMELLDSREYLRSFDILVRTRGYRAFGSLTSILLLLK
jgi:hypothetical protein